MIEGFNNLDYEIVEEYLNSLNKKRDFSKYETLPEYKVNNKRFFTKEKKNEYQGFLIHLTKILGFDCRHFTSLVLYRDKGYLTVSKDKFKYWNSSYKNRKIIKHYSSYLNKSRYLKIKKKSEKKGDFKIEYHNDLDSFYKDSYNSKMTIEQTNWTKKTIMANILKFNNVALKEFDNSEIIAMDIDTHGEEIINKNSKNPISDYNEFSLKVLNELKQLPLNILLFERSKIGSGLHVYIKLKNLHNKEIIKESLKKILESIFPVTVEYRTKNKALRLPFSYDYEFVNIDSLKKETKIKRKLTLILERYQKEVLTSNEKLTDILNSLIPHEGYWDQEDLPKMNIFKRNVLPKNVKKFIEKKFEITKGNRIGGEGIIWDVAFYSLRVGYSLDKFIDLVNTSNISSKDLTKWNDEKKRKELSLIYNFAKSKFNPNFKDYTHYITCDSQPSEYFISNLSLLSDVQKNNINYTIDNLYYEKVNRDGDSKWLKIMIEDCKIIFPELIGKILFEEMNPREINKETRRKYRLTNQKMKDLKVGYQFSKNYLSLLKKQYPTIRRDINEIFKLFKESFLETYYHKSNPKTSYIPNFMSPTQYTVLKSKHLLIKGGFNIDSLFYKKENISSNNISINNKHTIICRVDLLKNINNYNISYIRDW